MSGADGDESNENAGKWIQLSREALVRNNEYTLQSARLRTKLEVSTENRSAIRGIIDTLLPAGTAVKKEGRQSTVLNLLQLETQEWLSFSLAFFRLSKSWGIFTVFCSTQFREFLQVFTFAILRKVQTSAIVYIVFVFCDVNRNLQVIVSDTWKSLFRASQVILSMLSFSVILLLQQQISHLALNCLPQHQI